MAELLSPVVDQSRNQDVFPSARHRATVLQHGQRFFAVVPERPGSLLEMVHGFPFFFGNRQPVEAKAGETKIPPRFRLRWGPCFPFGFWLERTPTASRYSDDYGVIGANGYGLDVRNKHQSVKFTGLIHWVHQHE